VLFRQFNDSKKWLECSKNTVNFDTSPVPLGFMVALGQVFLRGHRYSPVSSARYSFIHLPLTLRNLSKL